MGKEEIKYNIRMELNFLTPTEKIEILCDLIDDIRMGNEPVLKNITVNYDDPAYKRKGIVIDPQKGVCNEANRCSKNTGGKKAFSKKKANMFEERKGIFAEKKIKTSRK